MGAGLLLLGERRSVAGAFAPTGGLEQAVARGQVHDLDTLGEFLHDRLHRHGAVQAAFTAAAATLAGPYGLDTRAPWAELDDALDTRTTGAHQRATSRAQARALLRVARAAWPDEPWEVLGSRPHHAVVLGAAATRLRLDASQAAVLAAHSAVDPPAWAAVDLLDLDAVSVTVLLAEMAGHCDELARAMTGQARAAVAEGDWGRLWGRLPRSRTTGAAAEQTVPMRRRGVPRAS